MVSAACPDCSVLLVQMTEADTTNGPQDLDFTTSSATAAALGAVATAISFGGTEGGGSRGPSDLTGYTTAGHLVLAAAGDSGYLLEGVGAQTGGPYTPSYPASAPDVLGIGGTTLKQQTTTSYSEVVWNDQAGATGSGCSLEYSMPSFQTAYGASKFGTCAMRASVDISAVAQYAPASALAQEGGIAEYDAQDSWAQVVGTSASTPIIAGILTRLGLAEQVSKDFGVLYQHASAFNDVTSGTDDGVSGVTECTSDTIMCTAGTGWDGPTGLGTPNGPALTALAPMGNASSSSGGSVGVAGASSGGGTGVAPTTSSGCGCRLAGGGDRRDGALAVLGLGALAGIVARRRRRSGRSRPSGT
jgi:MYXO-CTERM domain-containing protein